MAEKNMQKIYDKFGNDILHIIIHATAASINAETDCLHTESFVVGILTTGPNSVNSILVKQNVNLEKCLKIFKDKLASKKPKKTISSPISYENLKKSKRLIAACVESDKISLEFNRENKTISLQHMFLAILQVCPEIKNTFLLQGMKLKNFIEEVRGKNTAKRLTRENNTPEEKPEKPATKEESEPKVNQSVFDSFCVNMTELATKNKFDPIIARDDEIENVITILCRRNKSNPILVGPPGSGKAQPLNSLVLTKEGWKRMGDMQVGDLVVNPDGKLIKVTGIYPQGEKEISTIEFWDGRKAKSCRDHLWEIYGRTKGHGEHKKRAWEVLDLNKVDNILKNTKTKVKIRLVSNQINNIAFKTNDFFIHPYILGCLLGDGNMVSHALRFSNKSKIILDKFSSLLHKDYKIKKISKNKCDYRIIRKEKSFEKQIQYGERSNLYVKELENLGLWSKYSYEKFIPDIYKNMSCENKISLLCGLMDTDGNVCKRGSLYYCTTSLKLATDIQDLIWSLGGICKIKEKHTKYTYKNKKMNGRTSYNLSIRIKNPSLITTKGSQKNKRTPEAYQYNDLKLRIKNIYSSGKEICQCIKIDSEDGLYITDNYIVTHNTAIIEGVCQRIVSGTVPQKLKGNKIFGLNLGAIIAGTKYRGEFETRLQNLIKGLQDDPSCILFIDEIHNIVGAGSSTGSVDAANMLKPALARDLKCIGATTNAEYKKYFSGEGALERRFEKIEIDEPSKDQVKKILMGIKQRLEEFHKCEISEEAVDMSINLTSRYLPNKFFPDKAIDCIDTACAKYAWKNMNAESDRSIITQGDIAAVVSKQCQVPLEVILWDNNERLKNTNTLLTSRIIGQDHVVKAVCRTLKNAYSGVRNPDKPIGIFVFGGQTGTGKTYVAKELAKALFAKESSFIRVDMTEFSEPHSVSKITGSPPGYVGFNDVDVLADKIKRRPYCVLLLDEIEKAHPDVMKLFLQVMADGILTDSAGNKIDCKNVILIMTGNFGMNAKGKKDIGFGNRLSKTVIEKEQARLIDFCKENYGVEFINRVDNFIPFMPLNDEDLLKVIALRLKEFVSHVVHTNCAVSFSDEVPVKILQISKEEHGMNATVINRLISKYIEPCVADVIIDLPENDGSSHEISIEPKDSKDIKNIGFVATIKKV
jgi:ATP-dependent Clp protease ATP-binding subunit ClpA